MAAAAETTAWCPCPEARCDPRENCPTEGAADAASEHEACEDKSGDPLQIAPGCWAQQRALRRGG
eukprot:9480075-Alexandrium_andersonii.AAC.1